MTVASLPDVVARLGRQPLPDEEELLTARLADAEAAIAARIPSLTVLASSDPRFRANLIAVECDVALRAAGIPSRLETVLPGPGTVVEMQDGRAGFISIRGEEWRRLGIHQMDVWNPYGMPFEDLGTLDPSFAFNVGWGPWGLDTGW
jgi:hypothetical protein